MTTPTLLKRLHGKRFGLVLSAGYFGFYGHAGFLRALKSSGLKPSAYAGSSAGGLVSAYAAAGATPEFVEETVLQLTRNSFWDPDPIGAVIDAVRGQHGSTGILKGARFQKLLRATLPVEKIEDCPVPLTLVAANISDGTSERFHEGDLASRVHACCAYPGLFRAVRLDGRLYWDGGLVDKAPALALLDGPAGKGLDALLVHYLPSRTRGTVSGPFAYAKGMGAALSAVRRDHFRLQLQVLEARGFPVYVVESNLPPVSPTTLERGYDALAQARLSFERALEQPPRPFGQH